MHNIKELFFYGGIDAESYATIRGFVEEENKKSLRMYVALCSFLFLVLFVGSFFSSFSYINRAIYLFMFIITTVIHLILMKTKVNKITPLEDIFIFVMYGFGIFLSANNPSKPTISYIVLLVLVPLVFTDVPFRIISGMLFSILAYTVVAVFALPRDMLMFNFYNIIAYSFLSAIISTYLSKVKIERMLLLYRNKQLIEYDQMTGLFNRASYDKAVNHIKNTEKAYLKIVSMDINGLKRENDTYGHAAGDEMIIAAANCFQKVIRPYGKSYRIGGDEFAAVIEEKTEQDFSRLIYTEAENCICKSGTKLSISVGEADLTDSEDICELVHLADKRMYEEKRNYYKLTGDMR